MFEIAYRIPEELEEKLTDELLNRGEHSFSVETREEGLFIVFYRESPGPVDFPAGFSERTVREINCWNSKWADGYAGSELTDTIFIKPSGAPYPLKNYSRVITLDPLDAFGDGHHPTTRLCAGMLEEYIEGIDPLQRKGLSMIDAGTGTGILAIAACMMGLEDVELFDYDPMSVQKAAVNAELNSIPGLNPFLADIYDHVFQRKYDIITANLLTNIIEDNIVRLAAALKPDGVIILSGIGVRWTSEILLHFRDSALNVLDHRILEEWNGFMLSPAGRAG